MEEIEILKKENEELKQKLEMIEMFYEENIIERMKRRLYMKYIKEKKKNANYTNNRNNDKATNYSIYNNGNGNIRNNDNNKIFNS